MTGWNNGFSTRGPVIQQKLKYKAIVVSSEVEEINILDYEAIFSKIVKSERGKVRKLTADFS